MREQHPLAAHAAPESGRLGAGFDEREIVAVGHAVDVDLERSEGDLLFLELVVPAEGDRAAHRPSRDRRGYGPACAADAAGLRARTPGAACGRRGADG